MNNYNSKNDAEFDSPYPRSFGFLRIGTPINADINKAISDYPAFDMGILAKQNYLLINQNSTAETKIVGGGFNTKSQDAWGYSAAGELGFKSGFVDGSLSFNISQSKNIAKSVASQNVSAYSKQESEIKLSLSVTPDTILECATPLFREKIIAIRKAETIEKMEKAFAEFYKFYGTGFIYKLYLGAYGVFKGKAYYDSDFEERKFSIGGGASIGGVLGAASTAVQYVNEHMNSNAKGDFEARAFGTPANSEAYEWVKGFLKEFSTQQLTKLSSLDAWSKVFNAPSTSSKKLEFKEREPNKDPIPPYTINNIDEAIQKMKLDNFTKYYSEHHGGQNPPPGAYEEFIADLKKQAASSASDINHGSKLVSSSSILYDFNVNTVTSDTLDVQSEYCKQQNINFSENLNNDEFDGYSITGFEYLPWEKIFPELKKLEENLTLSQVTIGCVMAWISIRGLFGQYLIFCTQYPEIAPNGIKIYANAYQLAMNEMLNEIDESITQKNCDLSFYESLENKFRDKLKKHDFHLLDHYKYLIANYDWLSRVPFGAVAIVLHDNKYWFENSIHNQLRSIDVVPEEKFPTAILVEKEALRLYPIISTDKVGKPYFAWISAKPIDNKFFTGFSLTNWLPKYDDNLEHFTLVLAGIGMHRSPGDLTLDYRAKVIKENSDIVNILPEEKSYNKNIWSLRSTKEGLKPDCLVFSYKQSKDFEMLLSGTGRNIKFKDSNNAASDITITHQEINLVPINYHDVELAGNEVKSGGVPMWFESRTDKIIEKLNKLK